MPELPEVEIIVRDLKTKKLIGRTIEKAAVFWPRSIATPKVPEFVAQIRGKKIMDLTRRAKFIVLHLDGNATLLIHLRMTGRLNFTDPATPRDRHEHVLLLLDDGRELRFRDIRKFGKWYLTQNGESKLTTLGPEPLDPLFNVQTFYRKLTQRDRMLKPLLLDQSFIAGLGNIYIDEALWEAKLHPETNSAALEKESVVRLYQAIQKVLKIGIKNLGTSLGKSDVNFYSVGGRRGRNQDALRVFRKTGEPCPRCKTPIQRLIVGQRSSHICPQCQNGSRKKKN